LPGGSELSLGPCLLSLTLSASSMGYWGVNVALGAALSPGILDRAL